MAHNSVTASRRGVLGALAVAPIALAAPASSAMARFSPNRRAWDVAIAAVEKATFEDKAYDAIYLPIAERFSDEVAKLPARADRYAVAQARGAVREFDEGRVRVEPYARPDFDRRLAASREIVAADDDRTAKIAAIDKRLGYSEAEAKWEALGDARYQAEWAVMDIPAPDQPALLWKLEKLLSTEDGGTAAWSREAVAQTMADARRLLSNGRA